MKKYSLLLLIIAATSLAYAQGPAGLIAHWDMDSSANDVSGGGHNGHTNNVIFAPGNDGIMGHGYYFNGVNSSITVPYSPAFNVSRFSICATLKIQGFNSATCQHNIIFTRGKTGTGVGNYFFSFCDDNGCTVLDSTTENFLSIVENRTVVGASYSYTPHISSGVWYKVVVTFNDTVYKMYVNGVLEHTSTLTTPGVAMGTSTDSISIGYNVFEPAYTYPFKGVIDDILFYDRQLTDSQAVHYGDTCGIVTTQPVPANTTIGGTCSFTTNSSIVGASYQWQQNTGSGFVNLTAVAPFSGVNTNTLTITGVSVPLTGTQYRCVITNSWVCTDTTTAAILNTNVGLGSMISEEMVSIVPNPAQNNIAVKLPYYNSGTDHIQLINKIGQVVSSKDISANTTDFDLSKLPADMYIVVIHYNDQVIYKKIQKF